MQTVNKAVTKPAVVHSTIIAERPTSMGGIRMTRRVVQVDPRTGLVMSITPIKSLRGAK